MKPNAIVYSSNTGFTARYAEMLGRKTGLPIYELGEKSLRKGTPVVFCGWLMASHVKDYKRTAREYRLCAVCAVGLCATGTLQEEVRKATKIPADVPLFTLQGGMDHSKLRGVYKKMIGTLIKMLAKKKDRTADETAMLEMIRQGGDYVNEENLSAVLEWWEKQC